MNDPKIRGKIIEELPNTQFKVELGNGRTIRAYTAGKLKLAKIKIMLGDEVDVVFDPSLGGEIGRIVYRI